MVFQSSIGAEKRHGAGLIDGLAAVEERFDLLEAPVLTLRCGYFFTNLLMDADGLRAGVLGTWADPDEAQAWVDPRDIGEVVAARLLNPDWNGHEVQAVHGPEDLSWRQVAGILAEVTGRPFRVKVVGDDQARANLESSGVPPGAAAGAVDMTAGLRGFAPEQSRTVLTTTPTTLGAWAWEHVRPLVSG
jgi:uncharacterized protein YbjT (DUF2867 family)